MNVVRILITVLFLQSIVVVFGQDVCTTTKEFKFSPQPTNPVYTLTIENYVINDPNIGTLEVEVVKSGVDASALLYTQSGATVNFNWTTTGTNKAKLVITPGAYICEDSNGCSESSDATRRLLSLPLAFVLFFSLFFFSKNSSTSKITKTFVAVAIIVVALNHPVHSQANSCTSKVTITVPSTVTVVDNTGTTSTTGSGNPTTGGSTTTGPSSTTGSTTGTVTWPLVWTDVNGTYSLQANAPSCASLTTTNITVRVTSPVPLDSVRLMYQYASKVNHAHCDSSTPLDRFTVDPQKMIWSGVIPHPKDSEKALYIYALYTPSGVTGRRQYPTDTLPHQFMEVDLNCPGVDGPCNPTTCWLNRTTKGCPQ